MTYSNFNNKIFFSFSEENGIFDGIIINGEKILENNISNELKDSIYDSEIDNIIYGITIENIKLLCKQIMKNENIYHDKENRLQCIKELSDCIEPFVDEDLNINMAYKKLLETYSRVSNSIEGFVYLIGLENGLYKIGKTTNIKQRMNPFSVSFPMSWDLIYSFKTKDFSYSEKYLHKKFKDKRKIGERFCRFR